MGVANRHVFFIAFCISHVTYIDSFVDLAFVYFLSLATMICNAATLLSL